MTSAFCASRTSTLCRKRLSSQFFTKTEMVAEVADHGLSLVGPDIVVVENEVGGNVDAEKLNLDGSTGA